MGSSNERARLSLLSSIPFATFAGRMPWLVFAAILRLRRKAAEWILDLRLQRGKAFLLAVWRFEQ